MSENEDIEKLFQELQDISKRYPPYILSTKPVDRPYSELLKSLGATKIEPNGVVTMRIIKSRAEHPTLSEHLTTVNFKTDWAAMRLTSPDCEGVQPEIRDTFMREVAASEYQLALKDAFQCEEGLGDKNV
jgi:hypothetical protein